MYSLAVLGMLRMESGKFNEFVGARISEVKVNSNMEKEWVWLMGNCNPADLGTRPTVSTHSLKGDQLAAASKQIEKWDFVGCGSGLARKG